MFTESLGKAGWVCIPHGFSNIRHTQFLFSQKLGGPVHALFPLKFCVAHAIDSSEIVFQAGLTDRKTRGQFGCGIPPAQIGGQQVSYCLCNLNLRLGHVRAPCRCFREYIHQGEQKAKHVQLQQCPIRSGENTLLHVLCVMAQNVTGLCNDRLPVSSSRVLVFAIFEIPPVEIFKKKTACRIPVSSQFSYEICSPQGKGIAALAAQGRSPCTEH